MNAQYSKQNINIFNLSDIMSFEINVNVYHSYCYQHLTKMYHKNKTIQNKIKSTYDIKPKTQHINLIFFKPWKILFITYMKYHIKFNARISWI